MSESYVLHIDALDPKALPLSRLAKYLDRFAKILGHEEGVHLDGIRSGSTNIVCRIDPDHAKVVGESLQALVDGQGAKTSRSAYEGMMRMLAKDKAKAVIFKGDKSGASGKRIIDFSRALPCDEIEVIEHDNEISGYLIGIDAKSDLAKIRLREGDRIYTGIHAKREIAERMASHLYRPVRVFGDAVWTRNMEGFWDLKKIEIVDFMPLEEVDIVDIFEKFRNVEGMKWREFDDPQAAFHALRHGPE